MLYLYSYSAPLSFIDFYVGIIMGILTLVLVFLSVETILTYSRNSSGCRSEVKLLLEKSVDMVTSIYSKNLNFFMISINNK